MKTTKETRHRNKIIRMIANLNDRDFEAVVFHLLGNDLDKEIAYKILGDVYSQSPVYGPYVGR